MHSSYKFQNILSIVDKSSPGYDKLMITANRKLKSPEDQVIREEFEREWTSNSLDVTMKYYKKIINPTKYKNGKDDADRVLKKLAKHAKCRSSEIKVHKLWKEFTSATARPSYVENRVNMLKDIFNKYRNEFIKCIHNSGNDLPSDLNTLLTSYKDYPQTIQSIDKSLSPPKKVTSLPRDYLDEKQHTLSLTKMHWITGARWLQLMCEKQDLILKPIFAEIAELSLIFENGIHSFALNKNGIIALEAPTLSISPNPRSNEMQLHSETGPSFDSADTGKVYYMRGVFVGRELWKKCYPKKKSNALKCDEIFTISNIEQRRVVIEGVGADILASAPNAIKTPPGDETTKHGNQLILIKNVVKSSEQDSWNNEAVDVLIVKYKDPSTGRVYHSFVPPRHDPNNRNSKRRTDPDEALAWKFGFDSAKEYYNGLKAEG